MQYLQIERRNLQIKKFNVKNSLKIIFELPGKTFMLPIVNRSLECEIQKKKWIKCDGIKM